MDHFPTEKAQAFFILSSSLFLFLFVCPYKHHFVNAIKSAPRLCRHIKIFATLGHMQLARAYRHILKNIVALALWWYCRIAMDCSQCQAILECTAANLLQRIWQFHSSKATASLKDRTAKRGNRIWQNYWLEGHAVCESIIINTHQCNRQIHTWEAWTAWECLCVNFLHKSNDWSRCQCLATPVFASCFISTTCVLNGRKVMTQIL